MPNLQALEPYINQIDPEKIKLFDWFVAQQAGKSPFAGKRILVNGHQDPMTGWVIYVLAKLGADVEAAQIGTHALPNAKDVFKEAEIPFYQGQNSIPVNKKQNYYDICLDCAGALVREGVSPKLGMVELTHVDPSLYLEVLFPIIDVDKSDVKISEVIDGTGRSFGEAYIELLSATLVEIEAACVRLKEFCEKNIDAQIFAHDTRNEEAETIRPIAFAYKLLDLINDKRYGTIAGNFDKHDVTHLKFGRATADLQKLVESLRLLKLSDDDLDDSSDDNMSSGSRESSGSRDTNNDSPSSTPPSDSYLNHYNSSETKRRSIVLSRIKMEKFVIFGGGKVGNGIAFALLKIGVPSENITILEKSSAAIKRAKFKAPYKFINIDDNREMLDALKKAHVVVTATGQEGLLTNMGLTPNDIPGKLANMGHYNELGENFKDKKTLGDSPFAFNFNKRRLKKLGYATDPLYLTPPFVGLCQAAEILARPNHSLSNGLQPLPREEDSQILAQFSHLYPKALSNEVWQYVSLESSRALALVQAEQRKVRLPQTKPSPQATETQVPETVALKNSVLTSLNNKIAAESMLRRNSSPAIGKEEDPEIAHAKLTRHNSFPNFKTSFH